MSEESALESRIKQVFWTIMEQAWTIRKFQIRVRNQKPTGKARVGQTVASRN